MEGTGAGGVVLRVLGSPVLELDGRAQPLPPGRPGRLVATLLVARGRVVTDDRLVDEVWGEDLPADARAALHTNVGRARRALGPAATRLERVAAGYRFDLTDVTVDADDFVASLARARGLVAGDPVGALAAYDAALRLWQGPAWAGFADDVAQGEAVRLEESLLAAREEHAETLLALGRAQEAADELRPLVARRAVARPAGTAADPGTAPAGQLGRRPRRLRHPPRGAGRGARAGPLPRARAGAAGGARRAPAPRARRRHSCGGAAPRRSSAARPTWSRYAAC